MTISQIVNAVTSGTKTAEEITRYDLAQIKEKNYPSLLSEYSGEMVLVGVNYNVKTKEHSCKIENIEI